MTRRATLERLLFAAVFAVTAGLGCPYDPTYELDCDDEGAREGDRVCRDGVWVTDPRVDGGGDDAGAMDAAADAACSGSDCPADMGPDAPCDPESNVDFCGRLGFDCGDVTAPDNCGVQRNVLCGSCTEPQTCGGGGEDNVCGCEAESNGEFCTRLVKTCDDVTAADNCGESRTVNCGMCTAPAICGGGGNDNVCACPDQTDAEFCDVYGAVCGALTAEDECGQMRTTSCGMCDSPETCGGGGDDNQCGCGDAMTVCQALGAECGMLDVTGKCSNKQMVNCGGCRDNAGCNMGSNTCECDAGFQPDGLGNCEDIDECGTGADNCDTQASCTNTAGGFDCECNPGWTGDGTTCADVDECSDGSDNCDTNAICTNTPGSFTCECDTGWRGNGTNCSDIDECTSGAANCDTHATCVNNPGGFDCTCDAGWMGDGMSCTDIDECADNSDDCDTNATCSNTPGGYDCTCKLGFTGNGKTCTAIPDPIVSVQTVEITMGTGVINSNAALAQTITSANAVPFVSTRTTGSSIRDFTVDVSLADGQVDVSRANGGDTVVVVVTVVEFDPAEVSVQTDSFTNTASNPLASNVTPGDAFALFAYKIGSSHEDKDDFMVSGKLTSNSLDMGRSGSNGSIAGHYWVAEAQNGAFAVQHETGMIGNGMGSVSIPIAAVDPTTSFVVYSHRTSVSSPNGSNGQIACRITTATSVECSRDGTSDAITNLEVQVVELASGKVERNRSNMTGSTTTDTGALSGTFDTARSMGWGGQTGAHGACETAEVDNGGTPSGFATVELTGASEITVTRVGTANDSARCTWEAVEW